MATVAKSLVFPMLLIAEGGLVTQRHNEVRDALGDLAAMGYKDVIREPVVSDGDGTSPVLMADLGI